MTPHELIKLWLALPSVQAVKTLKDKAQVHKDIVKMGLTDSEKQFLHEHTSNW